EAMPYNSNQAIFSSRPLQFLLAFRQKGRADDFAVHIGKLRKDFLWLRFTHQKEQGRGSGCNRLCDLLDQVVVYSKVRKRPCQGTGTAPTRPPIAAPANGLRNSTPERPDDAAPRPTRFTLCLRSTLPSSSRTAMTAS